MIAPSGEESRRVGQGSKPSGRVIRNIELKESDRDHQKGDTENFNISFFGRQSNPNVQSKKSIPMDGLGCMVLNPNRTSSSRELPSEENNQQVAESRQLDKTDGLVQKKTMSMSKDNLSGGIQSPNLKEQVDLKVEVSVHKDVEGTSVKEAVFQSWSAPRRKSRILAKRAETPNKTGKIGGKQANLTTPTPSAVGKSPYNYDMSSKSLMKIIVQHSGAKMTPQKDPNSVSYEVFKKSRGDSKSVMRQLHDSPIPSQGGVKSQDLSVVGTRRDPSKIYENDDLNALMRINKLQRAEIRTQVHTATHGKRRSPAPRIHDLDAK